MKYLASFVSSTRYIVMGLGITLLPLSCGEAKQTYTAGEASTHTLQINEALRAELPFENSGDSHNAMRGFIAQIPNLQIKTAEGRAVWDMPSYDFLQGEVPATVNPSLWRQAKLNNLHGLFEVTDGIYQLRGFDLANMTLIKGETGWIVVDPLTSLENSAAALAFANKQLGDRPVVAVIYTHSHIDHFGGVLGVVDPKDVANGRVKLVAPKGFMVAATSENTIAGVAMRRRSDYMYGFRLPRSITGHIDAGLGKEPAQGSLGVIEPNQLITETGQTLVIDGMKFIFQYVPESEAPAELTFYLPKQKAFCGAELVSHTLHNLYTLRGAQVRNAVLWSAYIDEALNLFSDSTVYFGSHHWPVWGNGEFLEFMKTHRDTYKYIHDQTVRWFNQGYTSEEIAERLALPTSLSKNYYNRGYYGTLRHNAKAVYQYYLGWYDSNPANLNPLPSSESAARYVEMMGGAAQIMIKAKEYYQQGEYRWLAELLNKLVFAEPNHKDAKNLLAQTYEQLAYQAESAPWRDNYLTAAYELRNGSQAEPMDNSIYRDVLYEADPTYMFDTLSVRINAEKAEGLVLSIKVEFPEINSSTLLHLENSVLHHRESTPKDKADATMQITWDLWVRMAVNEVGMKDVMLSKDFKVQGSRLKLLKFLSLLETPEGNFNIVTP